MLAANSSIRCRFHQVAAAKGAPIVRIPHPRTGSIMLAASAKFRPAVAWFARQIAPSVLATLIAALVIAGYNRAFSGHLASPRLSAVRAAMDKVTGEPGAPAGAATDAAANPRPAWTTQVVEILAPTGDLERSFDKDEGREAAKDQSKLRVADATPAAAPVAPRPVVVRQ